MKPQLNHERPFSAYSKCRNFLRLVAWCAALCFSLISTTRASAQSSGLQQLFDGVRRGTATPELLRDVFNPFSGEDQDEAVNNGEQQGGDQRNRGEQPRGASESQAGRDRPAMVVAENQGELLPLPRVEGTLPLAGWDTDVDIQPGTNGRIDRLFVRDASLSRVLALLAQTYHLNIVASNDIDAIISITLRDVELEEALTSILSVANYTWVSRNGIILITPMIDGGQLPAEIQGRQIQVFELDFASAAAVSNAVSGFLSPVGSLSVTESDPSDNRRTREMIVVEDLPQTLDRIAAYIHQVDIPPRQVLLEAHILQVTLRDNDKCGVDFDALLRAAGSNITIETTGFASDNASPAFLATISGGDLGSVIELLQSTTDTKTLGSPKLLVLNQQEAMIHVGEDIGYQGSQTTTETSTFQNVQFLQVGVVLSLTPRITRDDRVLLHVRPEVSTGQINPLTQVPDKATTELETDVMLRDGQGMVIGGLIKETDTTQQSKIPYLGSVRKVGALFRRSEVTKERAEIIVAIVPRILPYQQQWDEYEQGELVRAGSPLFQGALKRTDRPWEAVLPDGKRVAKPVIPPPHCRPYIDRSPMNCPAPWPSYYVPHKPYPEQQLYDDCVEPAAATMPRWQHARPDLADEFVPEYGGYATPGGAVISDQP